MKISRLYPECKDYVWGGEKLKTRYGKHTEKSPCAESWELSFHKDGPSRLCDGKTIADSVRPCYLGENVNDLATFPMLVKLIDAKCDLSVQVHPSDEYAMEHEGSCGKSEAWYIVEAERGAGIYLGFNRDVTKEEYVDAIRENRLTGLLNFYEVRAGECYYIPAGTIHAIGSGCLICEIQQNSNITYRVYDWGRIDKNGKTRELHIEKALAVTSLEKYDLRVLTDGLICANRYFSARKISISENTSFLADKGSFQCIICVSGEGVIDGQALKLGDSFFVPANYGSYTLSGDMEVILAEVRKYFIGISVSEETAKVSLEDDTGRTVASLSREAGRGDITAEFIADTCRDLLCEVNMTADGISEIRLDGMETAPFSSEQIMYILNKKLA